MERKWGGLSFPLGFTILFFHPKWEENRTVNDIENKITKLPYTFM